MHLTNMLQNLRVYLLDVTLYIRMYLLDITLYTRMYLLDITLYTRMYLLDMSPDFLVEISRQTKLIIFMFVLIPRKHRQDYIRQYLAKAQNLCFLQIGMTTLRVGDDAHRVSVIMYGYWSDNFLDISSLRTHENAIV